MKKITLAAVAGIALLATATTASAGGYDQGYHHGYGGHHGNNASFSISFGPRGHVNYGLHFGPPRVYYVQPHRTWRPATYQYNHYQRPHRHQRIVHRSRGYCPQHGGWHR
jgi:hypothetical protein